MFVFSSNFISFLLIFGWLLCSFSFQHPADSTNPKLIHWLCKEEIRERDKDKDGKLNFQEYFNGLFDSLRNYDEVHYESDTSETTPAKKKYFRILTRTRMGSCRQMN